MPIRIDENVMFSGTDATAAIELIDQAFTAGTAEIYADVNRTDTYVEDGTILRPFKDLEDALTVANTNATSVKPYRVFASPGIYTIGPITINPYVKLEGAGWQTTILKQSAPLTTHFITMSPGTVLRDIAVWGPTQANTAAIHIGTSDPRAVAVTEVAISRGYFGILCDPGASRAPVLIQNLVHAYAGNTIDTMVKVTGFGDIFCVSSLVSGPADSVRIGAFADGANAVCTLVNFYHEVPGAATEGVCVDNGGMVRVISSVLSAGHAAIHAGSGNDSRVRVESTIIHRTIGGGYTHDLLIDNATVTTTFTGFMSRDRITNLFNADIFANFINHEPAYEGAGALGEFVVGDDTDVLPLLDYGKSAYLTGLVSGGAVTRNVSPSRVLTVAAGTGYINDGAHPIKVTWGPGSATITATKTEYVYVDRTATIQHSEAQPVYATSIVLAQATANATDIVVLTKDEISISHSISRLQEYFEDVIGPISVTGGLVTASVTAKKLDVSVGGFVVGLSERDITGGHDVPFYYVNRDGAGGWVYTAATAIDTAKYDSGVGGVPVVYPGADHWKKDAWYIVVGDAGEVYYCVYGQTPYNTEALAIAGPLPSAPEILTHYGMRAATIVSHDSDAVITSIQDIRPMIGQNAPIGTLVAANHNTLTNLGAPNDDHPQYQTAARQLASHSLYAGAHITNGDAHNHTGGAGAQVDHVNLANIGTRTHVQLEGDVAAKVSSVTGTAPIVSSGGTSPAISITAASGAAAGSMSSADFTKLAGIAAGATVNVFGNGYQTAISLARVTYNTNTSFQNKATLTTPALTAGTYRISWTAVIDGSATNQNVESQLYNTTDAAIVGVVQVFRPGNAAERLQVGGFAEVVFAGVAKVFNLQYRTANTGSTVGIADARIEIWRVA